jgi:hypothetical protein
MVYPEFRIFRAIANSMLMLGQSLKPEGLQNGIIKGATSRQITDRHRDMIDHRNSPSTA